MNPYIPIFIIVLSNTFYHICAKSTPAGVNTFAALSVTYTVGAFTSVLLFFLTQKNVHVSNLILEYHQLNWSSFILGLAVVGLEAGYLLMYKTGWNISTGQIMQSAILAVILIFVGYFLYQEAITLQKVLGIAICMVGLYLINR